MARRRATDAETRALMNGEGLASNSTFDGVDYWVEPQSKTDSDKPATRKSTVKKGSGDTSAQKADAGTSAARSATEATSTTTDTPNDGTAATRGPVTVPST